MKELFIHIGRAKTGTTVIQQFATQNSEMLKQCNLRYAETGHHYINHQPLAWSLFKEAYERGIGKYWNHCQKYAVQKMPTKDYWRQLNDEIASCPEERILISSEEFGVVLDIDSTARLLAEFLPDVRVKIIVYFRRQDQFLQAVYNEVVKNPEIACKQTFHDYIKPILEIGGADPLKVLTPFARYFGKNNLAVRAYERTQFYKGNLLDDFLRIFFIDRHEKFKDIVHNPNPNISPQALECIRLANKRTIPQRSKLNALISQMIDGTKEKAAFATHSLVSLEEQRQLLARFEDSNRIVAREYMNRPAGDLFRESSETPPLLGDVGQAECRATESLVDIILMLWEKLQNDQSSCS